MQIFDVSVLQLDDYDFLPGKLGDLGGLRGAQPLVGEYRIIMWRGLVLKNNFGYSVPPSYVSAMVNKEMSGLSALSEVKEQP